MAVVQDLFNEGSDTNLNAHTSDSGHTYSVFPDFSPNPDNAIGSIVKGGLGYLEANNVSGNIDFIYSVDGDPLAGATEFDIEWNCTCSVNSGLGANVGALWYAHLANGTGYYCIYDANGSQVTVNRQAGTATTIGSFSLSYTPGANIHIKIEVRGNNFKVYVDGILRINVTDSTYSDDSVGVFMRSNSGKIVRLLDLSFSFLDGCTGEDPTNETVRAIFNGNAGTKLSEYVTDSGHAFSQIAGNYTQGHIALKGGGGAESVNTGVGYFLDTELLQFAPRTKNYEIGMCFNRADSPNLTNYLHLFARMTDDKWYEVRVGNNGFVDLRKAIRGGGLFDFLFTGSFSFFALRLNDFLRYGPIRWGRYTELDEGEPFNPLRNSRRRRRVPNVNYTTLDSSSSEWLTGRNVFLQFILNDSTLSVKINSSTALNVSDAAITEVGEIALGISGDAFGAPANGYWAINWLYVDDSYTSFPTPNKAVVFNEAFKASEGLLRFEEDPNTKFIILPDAFNNIENLNNTIDIGNQNITMTDGLKATDLLNTDQDVGCWYDTNWTKRKKITIDNSMVVGGSALSNFPFLVLLTDSDVAAAAQTDGDDILFTAADGVTKLSHELVRYDTGTGKVEAWVKIPSLSNSVDTEIYMYYGNGGASAQEDPTNVWDTNYKAVYHLEGSYNGTANEVIDSTSNANHGVAPSTNKPTQLDSKVGKGQGFDESLNQRVHLGSASSSVFPDSANATIEIIFKQTSASAPSTNNRLLYALERSGGPLVLVLANTAGNFTIQTWNGSSFNTLRTIDTISNLGTGYHYMIFKRTGGNTIIRLDGSEIINASETVGSAGANPAGISNGGAVGWHGEADEVKFSNTARSDNWLDTTWNNMNTPGSYTTLGAEETSCNELTVQILDIITGETTLAFPAKAISLIETSLMNDLIANGGTNKLITISEFIGAVDLVLPNLEINVTDSVSTSEAVSRAFDFAETIGAAETLDVSALAQILDTTSINDVVALYLLKSVADGVSLQDVLGRIVDLPETATLADVINAMRTLPGTQDLARAGDSIMITRTGTATFEAPEKTYYARDLKRLFVVNKARKVS